MAVSPINKPSTLRLMGMTSGMDTEAIIKQSLRFHQYKIDSKFRAKTILEWKQQSLNSVKDDLNGFRRSFLTVLGSSAMRLSSVYNSTVANVTGKNAGAVSIATTINSSPGTMKINQIRSLAKNTSVTTTGQASRSGTGFKLTDKLGEIKVSSGYIEWDVNNEAKVNVNGTDIVLKKSELDDLNAYETANTSNPVYTNTAYGDYPDLVKYINSKMWKEEEPAGSGIWKPTGNQIIFSDDQTDYEDNLFTRVTINGKSIVMYGKNTVSGNFEKENTIDEIFEQLNNTPRFLNFDTNGKVNIRLNGLTIGLDKNMTVEDMINKVNSSNAGVTMKYDRMSDQFTVESKKVGASSLSVWGLNGFGIMDGTYNNGSMAEVQINGEWIVKDTNTFDYRGLKISLNNTTAAGDEDIVVSLKRDATEPINKIKGFVEAYNSLIKKLTDLIGERKTEKERSYGPLTDEEKSLMTEKQIEQWETIAKKALLRNDAQIQGLLYSLRGALFDQVKAAGMSPSQLGLSTGNYFDGMGGQIVLDEDKLRKALEDDPEKVMNVFMGDVDEGVKGNRGLLWRMEDLMLGYINGGQSRSINSLESSIRKANEQMERLQRKMYDEEERLYKKFAAMETAMSKIQSQTEWMLSMLNASMNANNKKQGN